MSLFIFFFFFIASVLSSNRFGSLILELKDTNVDHEKILESIVIETMKHSFDYRNNSGSRFTPVVKEMGEKLQKSRIDAQNLMFSTYANYTKKLCLNSSIKREKGKLSLNEYMETVAHIGFVIFEAGALDLIDLDFKIPVLRRTNL